MIISEYERPSLKATGKNMQPESTDYSARACNSVYRSVKYILSLICPFVNKFYQNVKTIKKGNAL